MSELYAAGKMKSSNDKESNLYEIMFNLGLVEKHEEECEEILATGKRLKFPKGYYITLVYQLSCLLSEKEINNLFECSDEDLFFNNLYHVLSAKYSTENDIDYAGRFCKLFGECLNAYNRGQIKNSFIGDFVDLQKSFYTLLQIKKSKFPADKEKINERPFSKKSPKYYLGEMDASSIFTNCLGKDRIK